MAVREPYIDIRLGNDKYQKLDGVLYQYDHGLKMRIAGQGGSQAVAIQFSCIGLKEALSVTPTADGEQLTADIPDVLLIQNKELQCYIYVEENGSGVTVYEVDMTIVPRAKPSPYTVTQQQVSAFDTMVEELNTIMEAIDGMENLPSNLEERLAAIEQAITNISSNYATLSAQVADLINNGGTHPGPTPENVAILDYAILDTAQLA